MANNFDKFAILESFLDEVTSYLPEIQENLDRLQQQPGNTDMIEETYRRTHTIAGSAAMMEFGALAHVAQGMEDIFGDAIDHQTGLDAPTIALLRRSFGRLSRLVEHIRSGADDSPLVAEDDADRAAWRGAGASAAAVASSNGTVNERETPAGMPATTLSPESSISAAGIQMPDWLAAFAASSASTQVPGTDERLASATPDFPPVAEMPMPAESIAAADDRHEVSTSDALTSQMRDPWASSISNLPTGYTPAVPSAQSDAPDYSNAAFSAVHDRDHLAAFGGAPDDDEVSFDEMLRSFQASAGQISTDASTSGAHGYTAEAMPPFAATSHAPSGELDVTALGTSAMPAVTPERFAQQSHADMGFAPAVGQTGQSWQPALDEARLDAEAVERQVTALSDVISALREATQAMEDERGELRGFLDGSRDALERLEEWAGQQMGLDLRHSPESVRRYLPLSVIWVTTTRLKKLTSLLKSSDRTLTATQEQIDETLRELRAALDNVGQVYSAMSVVGGEPRNGFTATVAQLTWAPPTQPLPSVGATSSVMAASQPAQSQAVSAATRAKLEREVRDQLRRELEDEVRAEVAVEVRREEEGRLRQELQVSVRRQLLLELTPGHHSTAGTFGNVTSALLQSFDTDRATAPVQVTSEQSPEALEVFREEAQEHLQSITTGLAQLESSPGDLGVLQSIRRAMHTLKGAAGMMGFMIIQQMAHASEDLLDRLVESSLTLTPAVLSLLLDTSENLDHIVRDMMEYPNDQHNLLDPLLPRYAEIAGVPAPDAIGADAARGFDHSDAQGAVHADAADETVEPLPGKKAPGDLSVRLQLSKLDDLVNLFGELLINRSILEERVERLNRLVNDSVVVSDRLRTVGEQLETRFEAATLPSGRGGSSFAMGGQPRDAMGRGSDAGRRGSGGLQQDPQGFAREFDELELDRYTEFHRLSRGLSEGVADAVTLGHEMEAIIREVQASFARENRLSSDFQDRLLKARLVPLQSLVPRLYRAARASALRENKEIEFYSDGAGTEVDRKVFEEVAGPLLHLVRNAVNHGIERPGAREMAGKPRSGKIIVSAAYEGNQVVISVRDDGVGIDPERIRATAIARGWLDAYAHLSEKEAINLIFQPGMTTAETLTEESGRGVGLDVVRDTVSRLRGTIEVESAVGQGTVFTMKFPISLQIARAVLVKVGSQTLAIPMAFVDQIGRLDYYQRVAGPPPALEVRGEQYPLTHLASYLKLQPGPVDERASVLLINAGRRRLALLVDSVVAQQEVVSKPLGPHLREVRGVSGAAVLGNGQVVLILELHELLEQQPRGIVAIPSSTGEPGAAQVATDRMQTVTQIPTLAPATSAQPPTRQPAAAPAAAPPSGPAAPSRDFVVAPRPASGSAQHRVVVPPAAQHSYVLVVDDSPSVRRVVSNMLKAHGWEVQTARDGIEALEVIARQMPAAMLLDIEMPRMDGYELMATVRSQEQYRSLPLVVLTSRAATKHQQRALQLGADAYVVKPYQDEELLNTLTALVQGR